MSSNAGHYKGALAWIPQCMQAAAGEVGQAPYDAMSIVVHAEYVFLLTMPDVNHDSSRG